ncbi:hypothetical protein FHS29_005323 [Saccharothrix tamanrassetensis]|uniref:DUF3566 domain-containing protein n=1 Tax=Saccharothrix tamanrassetensis TaxID=1051531 RepID=A0A841CQT6_9PSEU|nr:DUF3566 domain-containing protein [Saccharothrix tamanrassetensis]MBB5958714.1 hypothetical protein [Saccharothrix tamanrassetensis]
MTSPEKPEDKTTVITRPGAEATPEQPAAQTSSGADAVDGQDAPAAPPPWQRVTSDAQYGEARQVGPGDPAPEQPAAEGGSQPAYPASDPDTVAVARPAITGTAARQAADQAGSGQAGSARTSVNLGAANGRPAASGSASRRPGRGPRRASLQVKRVDPWSVLKLALVLSVALFFVWLVAVGVLYGVLNGMGVWDKINNTANDLLQGNESSGDPLISAGRVFGVAAIVGAVNIVLFTALATVGAFVYNVSADLAGGLEVTLSERE